MYACNKFVKLEIIAYRICVFLKLNMQTWKRQKMVKKLFAFLQKAKKQSLGEENKRNKEDPVVKRFENIESEVEK